MLKKVVAPLAVLIILSITFSCGNLKKTSQGPLGEIIVLADSTDWELIKDDCLDVISPVIITPQKERYYRVNVRRPGDFSIYKENPSLVFLGTLETKGLMKDIIDQMLSNPEIRKSVESGENYMFKRDDQWAKGQFLLVLVSKNIEMLREKLFDNESEIFGYIHKNMQKIAENDLYERLENRELEQELFKKYGFSIRVPVDYHLASEKPEDNFLWFRRWNPQRGVFIHWEKADNVKELAQEYVVEKRNLYSFQYCDSMVTDKRFLKTKMEKIEDHTALKTNGLWYIEKRNIGGPFINYTFHDKERGLIFMIDSFIYYPQGEKAYFLRQLDIVARTFSQKPETFGIKPE